MERGKQVPTVHLPKFEPAFLSLGMAAAKLPEEQIHFHHSVGALPVRSQH